MLPLCAFGLMEGRRQQPPVHRVPAALQRVGSSCSWQLAAAATLARKLSPSIVRDACLGSLQWNKVA